MLAGHGKVQEAPQHGHSMCTAVSAHLSNTAAKRRNVAKQPLGQLRKVAEENRADVIAGDFPRPTANTERQELHGENVGRDALDPSARLDANVGPNAGIRRLLRLHSHKKRRTELASCKAWMLFSVTKTRCK